MISFKQYLLERRTYLKKGQDPVKMIAKGYIPLNDRVLRKKISEIHLDKVFRTESLEGIKNFKKDAMKVQLPTFMKGSRGLADGALVRPFFLLELEGKTNAKFDVDAWTVLDKYGKRWTYPGDDTSAKITKLVAKKLNLINFDSRSEVSKKINSLEGKEKKEFFDWYYKTAQKLISKENLEKLNNYLKTKDLDPDLISFDNDEILLHDYKLKRYWAIKEPFNETFERQSIIKPYLKKTIYNPWKALELFLKDYAPDDAKYCGFVTKDEIAKIDVEKGKYPKC